MNGPRILGKCKPSGSIKNDCFGIHHINSGFRAVVLSLSEKRLLSIEILETPNKPCPSSLMLQLQLSQRSIV